MTAKFAVQYRRNCHADTFIELLSRCRIRSTNSLGFSGFSLEALLQQHTRRSED